ncbi:hypothetical protein [Hyunsoonleella pacifica]|uniref:Uncharacterized protein n=1 Tax=Hyunsoonleella pacifica TaxID=1080224 RepID=A0A4Q9FV74_9FLAO|nr:hypothetical protein [Hyunsoonleella pacifica]TBN17929.1 hypothetical protein EYD46_06385 [Hyunsoonleella pacifica]GGD07700.1 hypothetical protein GCM10011368_07070 [Hyunsoonleella pacifica]
MNIVNEVEELKKITEKGYNVRYAVNYLADKKIYHIAALNILSIVYPKKKDLNEMLYSHPFYFDKQNEKNPFTEDFLTDADNSRLYKLKWGDIENDIIEHPVHLYNCPNNEEHLLSYEVIPYKEPYNKAIIILHCFECNEKHYIIKDLA